MAEHLNGTPGASATPPEPTAPPKPTAPGQNPDEPRCAASGHQAPPPAQETHGRRTLVWGLTIMVLAACLPVLAQVAPAGAAPLMWLASMPLCVAGAALAGHGLLRLTAARQAARDEDGGL